MNSRPRLRLTPRRRLISVAVVLAIATSLGLSGCSQPASKAGHAAQASGLKAMASIPSGSISQAIEVPFLMTAADRDRLRNNRPAFSSLIDQCNSELATKAKPVASLDLSPKYVSSGENSDRKTNTLKPDASMAYRAGLCYEVTGDTRYARHAQEIVDAWASTLTIVPNKYGQEELIFRMPYLIAAATWVKGVDRWDSSRVSEFLSRVVVPDNEFKNPANHGLWSVLTVAEAAIFTGNTGWLTAAENRWSELMAGEVKSDGTMPNEMARSDSSDYRGGADKGIRGMAYTHFTLLAASMAAKVFADAGHPVWTTAGGALLRRAFEKAAAWTSDPKTFPYYASNDGKLQGVRSASYFALLDRFYPDQTAEGVLKAGKISSDGFFLQQIFG